MKLFITSILLLISSISFAQEYSDYLIDKKNNKILCDIKQIKKGKVRFRQKGKSYQEVVDIANYDAIEFNGKDVLKNTLDIKIEKPESGYSYIYFYTANDRFYEVMRDEKKLIKMNKYSYYLHKVEANKTYTFYCEGNHHDADKLILEAEDGEIYFVKGVPGKRMPGHIYGEGYSTKLVIDNSELSKYNLLSMTKKAKK